MHNTYVYIATDLIDHLDLNNVVFKKNLTDIYHCSLISKSEFDKENLNISFLIFISSISETINSSFLLYIAILYSLK